MPQVLPTATYAMGAVLPPHLSPFVEEEDGDYVPKEKGGCFLCVFVAQSIAELLGSAVENVPEPVDEEEDREINSDDEQCLPCAHNSNLFLQCIARSLRQRPRAHSMSRLLFRPRV